MIHLQLPKFHQLNLKQLILFAFICIRFATFSQYSTSSICEGGSTSLFNPYSSGVWSSSDNLIATVDLYGNVVGITAGVCSITIQDDNSLNYTYYSVIVNSSTTLNPIVGADSVCINRTIQLYNATTTGTWSSSNSTVATVDNYGIVTGLNVGTTIISYTVCGLTVTKNVNVYFANPPTITLTSAIETNNQVLDPESVLGDIVYYFPLDTITFQIGGGATGAHFSSNTILPEGVTGTFLNGVFTIAGTPFVTVPLPTEDTVFYFEVIPTGGTYCANEGFGYTIDNNGNVVSVNENNGGTITLTPLCSNTIFGNNATFCASDYVYMTFSISGSATDVTASGLPVGLSGNYSSGVYTISGQPMPVFEDTQYDFTLTTTGGSCVQTTFTGSIFIMATPIIAPISGPSIVCTNSTITLSNSTPGGYWSSSDPAIANVSSIGIVTGNSAGTAVITYTLANMCSPAESFTVTVNATPNVLIMDQSICSNENVIITAIGEADSYTWSPSLSTSSVLFDSPPLGITTYTVTGTTNGCSSSSIANVTVNPLPMVNAGPDQTICEGFQVVLSGTGALVHTWDNGIVDGVPFIPTVGSTVYEVTGMDNNGCVNTDQTVITVNSPTQISPITGASNICTNSSLTLSNATSNGTWISSNANIASIDQSGQVNGNGAGIVTITYSINDACSTDQSTQIVVEETPFLAPITGENELCVNSSTSLYNSTDGGVWSSSDQNIAYCSPSGVITGLNPGICMITYTVTSGNCFTSEIFMLNIVNCTSIQLMSSANTDEQTVCFTNPIVPIEYSVSANATNVTVTSGTLPTGINGVYANQIFTISGTPTQAGVFSFTLTVQGSSVGSESSISGTISVDVDPNSNFTCLTNDLTMQFFSNSIIGTSYTWNLNGIPSTENNPTITFPTQGFYTVTLHAENSCGIDSTKQIFNLVGIEELAESTLLIYPNPFGSHVTIQLENEIPAEISIQDATGKVIVQQVIFSKLNTLNLESLAAGNYLMVVKQGEESVVKRIAKME